MHEPPGSADTAPHRPRRRIHTALPTAPYSHDPTYVGSARQQHPRCPPPAHYSYDSGATPRHQYRPSAHPNMPNPLVSPGMPYERLSVTQHLNMPGPSVL